MITKEITNNDKSQIIQLLSNEKYGNNNRRVGDKVGEKIYNFLFGIENKTSEKIYMFEK
jgi:hypothetical protein